MNSQEVMPGLATGLISAVIFNPIDKIIFSCCIQNKKLTDRSVWTNLFKGCMNNIATRIITSGLYFSFLDHYSSINPNKMEVAFLTAVTSSITNPIQLIKFNSWYHNCSSSNSISTIYKSFGVRGITIGIIPLISRDFIFNYIYLNNKKKDSHVHNIIVISGALVISSPFNLIKNKKYATNESLRSIISNFRFGQLGIGMTVARSCLSFYVSQIIYNQVKDFYNSTYY